jgi:hypothetical protein
LSLRLAEIGLAPPAKPGRQPILSWLRWQKRAGGRGRPQASRGCVRGPFHSVWIARRALPHRHHGACRFPVGHCVSPVWREVKAPKYNDDDSSPTGLGPGEQRLVAVVCGSRAFLAVSSSPARPIGTDHRGACLEGTRYAGPVGRRHARRGRMPHPGRACAGPDAALADLPSSPPCAHAGRLAVVPEGAPEMTKAPQRGASRANSIGPSSVRMNGQILWTLKRDRRRGVPESRHITFGARR